MGVDIISGPPTEMIHSVVASCEFISDLFDVEEKCLVWNWAGEIFRIIENVFDKKLFPHITVKLEVYVTVNEKRDHSAQKLNS